MEIRPRYDHRRTDSSPDLAFTEPSIYLPLYQVMTSTPTLLASCLYGAHLSFSLSCVLVSFLSLMLLPNPLPNIYLPSIQSSTYLLPYLLSYISAYLSSFPLSLLLYILPSFQILFSALDTCELRTPCSLSHEC